MKNYNLASFKKRTVFSFSCLVTLFFGIIGAVNSISQDMELRLALWPPPKNASIDYLENKHFSQSIAVGDVNGDGFDDIVVLSEKYVYIYEGSKIITRSNFFPDWECGSDLCMIVIENDPYDFKAVDLVDVNDDNIMDVIIGFDYPVVFGGVCAFYGQSTWTTPDLGFPLELDVNVDADWSIDGSSIDSDGEFGSSVANAGDLNDDGVDDIIVGAPGDVGKGKAYVFYGSSAGLPADHIPDAEIPPGYELTQSGMKYKIEGLGSIVDRDGHYIHNSSVYDNFMIGIPTADIDLNDDGYFEKQDAGAALIGPRWWCLSGDNVTDSRFGYALGNAGDVNGDGHSEVLVCSRKWGGHPQKVFLYLGDSDRVITGSDPPYQWSVEGFPDVQYSIGGVTFEPTVGSAGDINGDGYGDIFIGDKTYDPDDTDGRNGRVYIWYGGTPTGDDLSGLGEDQTPDSADIKLYPTGTFATSFSSFGYSVESGDINGDGFSDIVVGDPYCYHPLGGYQVGVRTGAIQIYFSTFGGPELNPPTNLATLNGYHNAVPLAWEAPQPEAQTGYNVYRSTSSGGSYTKIASSISCQYYRDENVINGQTYYYKVTAVYSEGESDFTPAVSGFPTTNGYKISSGGAQSIPDFNGVINTSEWADATQTVITYPGESDVVTLYTMNSNDYLYLAVDDHGNTTLDNDDTFGIIFDENHDREWPTTNTGEDGILQLFWNVSESASAFMGFYGTWPDQVYGSGWSTPSGINLGISTSSGHVQMEASLDLTSCPLNVSAGEEFGVLFYTFDGADYTFTGLWPQEIAQKLPPLASGYVWTHGPFSYGELELTEETGIDAFDNVLPKKFVIYQNYPNPFNPKTTIRYELPISSEVELTIYNSSARKVVTLARGIQNIGVYEYEWDATGYSSGLYFCRLQTKNGFVKTRKVLLMK